MKTRSPNFKGLALLAMAIPFSNLEASVASAQDTNTATPSSQIYEAAYFTAFVPRSALDMLERLPGFQIVVPDGKRGLGQGGANILINGQRLTGKSDNALNQVSRLNAASVVRIEIVDGASSGVPGLSGRVANIITRPPAFTGRWRWLPAFQRGTKANVTRGSINISGTSGAWDYTIGLENNGGTFKSRGDERREILSSGAFSIADEAFGGESGGPEFSADLAYQPSDDITANLELEFATTNINQREFSSEFFETSDQLLQQTNFFLGIDRTKGEVRGDIKFPAGIGTAKLISLYSFRDDARNSFSDVFPVGNINRSSQFETDVLTQEFIFRSEYDFAFGQKASWQVAGEFAQNSLNSENAFLSRIGDGLFTAQELSNPTTNIKEDRWEVTITHNRELSTKWDLQAALGAEYSTLSQQEVNGSNSKGFFRPKGFATATYTPSERLSIAAKLERDVGQLNFFDFVSVINLQENHDQLGNPDLVPQQLWRYELDTAWTSVLGHSVNLTLFAEDIEDRVDRIAIGDAGDAIGNIESASRYGFNLVGTIKGEPLGIKGVQVDMELRALKSSLIDPIGQFERQFSAVSDRGYSIEIQHDIPDTNWAYGGKISRSYFQPRYRVRNIDDLTQDPFMYVYAEHKDVYGLRVRGGLYNFNEQRVGTVRTIFDNRRDVGLPERVEARSRSLGPYILLDISGTF